MQLYSATFGTPCGPISVAVNTSGQVVATAFGELPALRPRLQEKCNLIGDTLGLTAPVRREVDEYFSDRRRGFDVAMAAQETAFQKRVWAELTAIPFGQTRSYGQLAAALGQSGAARAVGLANAANPLALLVPCHRVIGADGALGGFAFGATIKQHLLTHEGAWPADLL
jgi:methylated-DNA-[protein]-cysteine S-methyltransferase